MTKNVVSTTMASQGTTMDWVKVETAVIRWTMPQSLRFGDGFLRT